MTGKRSAILESGVAVASGPILVFSVYLLAAGHNQPGGGFAGGLVAGVLVVLAWSAGGTRLVRRILPIRSSALLGSGLLLAASAGFGSLLLGGSFLQSGYIDIAVPGIGTVKATSTLMFDIGVYLVVIGVTLGLTRALGEESEGSL